MNGQIKTIGDYERALTNYGELVTLITSQSAQTNLAINRLTDVSEATSKGLADLSNLVIRAEERHEHNERRFNSNEKSIGKLQDDVKKCNDTQIEQGVHLLNNGSKWGNLWKIVSSLIIIVLGGALVSLLIK